MVTRQVARKTVKEHITYDKPKRDARMKVSDKYEDYIKSKKRKVKMMKIMMNQKKKQKIKQ